MTKDKGMMNDYFVHLTSRTACEYDGSESTESPEGYRAPDSSCIAWGLERYWPTAGVEPGEKPGPPAWT